MIGAQLRVWMSLSNNVPYPRSSTKPLSIAFLMKLLILVPRLWLSIAIPHASVWLHVVPSSALGLHLQDQEFHHCLQYWLGVQMLEEASRCAVCQSAADCFGDDHVSWRVMATSSIAMTHSEMPHLLLPSLLLWSLGRKCHH